MKLRWYLQYIFYHLAGHVKTAVSLSYPNTADCFGSQFEELEVTLYTVWLWESKVLSCQLQNRAVSIVGPLVTHADMAESCMRQDVKR